MLSPSLSSGMLERSNNVSKTLASGVCSGGTMCYPAEEETGTGDPIAGRIAVEGPTYFNGR